VTPPGGTEPALYLSLYRRFRPQRFDEVLGQQHVTLALRNAVRDGRMGHAYLFSGPRGTGKTSTARILAKALDCAAAREGEPCGECDSCVEIARGTSMDVHELDAASNNGVDAMRDLVAHSALGTPGRWKVYIVDEVHMLSTAASNALLKTLEEPPGHVVFVLATTDAQKVLPTIRSRTQHFEFRLLGPEVLAGLLRRVREEAGLDLGEEALDSAVRRGRGSARDALSALDQVAAGGTVGDEIVVLAEIAGALAVRDAGGVLVGVAEACDAGHDAQRLAGELADYLRQGFLAMLSPGLVSMVGEERAHVEDTARRMGLPAVVRAMEALGRALVDMRDTPDPRVHLEATLIRLAHPEADDSTSALLERVERLERALASGLVAPSSATSTVESPGASPAAPSPPRERSRSSSELVEEMNVAAHEAAVDATSGGREEGSAGGEKSQAGGPELARRALGALRGQAGKVGERGALSPDETASSKGEGQPTVTATLPSRDELVQAWGDGLLASLPGRARARFRVGRFVATEDGTAVFALPNETHRSYCEEVCAEVESVLAARFGTAVPLRLVVDEDTTEELAQRVSTGPSRVDVAARKMKSSKSARSATPGSSLPAATGGASRQVGASGEEDHEDADTEADLFDPAVLEAETEPAGAGPSPEERIKLAFPGAEEV
jgi:DNA polymerase-3 subunit gamma/tau